MHRLWTPWRMHYVSGSKPAECIFCAARDDEHEAARLVLMRGEHAYVMMNLYPYNSGHVMVIPTAHVDTLEALTPAARAELMELTSLTISAARRVLRCDGFNLGTNIGAVAGAGIAQHLHTHLVPRWVGDANFMPILADTMVMPELLQVTHAKLRAELETLSATGEPGLELVAGAVVYLPDSRSVVLRRSKSGEIVVPKGHIEHGEAAYEAALREVMEETGYAAQIIGWVGSQRIELPGNRRQHIVYLLAAGVETEASRGRVKADTVLVALAELSTATPFAPLNAILARAAETLMAEFAP